MSGHSVWRCRGREIALGDRTLVMGIVNVTPDSFSDGGMLADADAAVKHAMQLVDDGADILDVGGESTRPGSDPVSIDEELARVVPVIDGLATQTDVPISVDTRKAEVARAALEVGAAIVNDVTAGAESAMLEVVRDSGAGLVLMHMRGEPKSMQADPRYDDVVREVRDFLADRIGAAVAAGVPRGQLCADPGIGFGKTLAHNLALLRDLAAFGDLRVPILVGVSRKRFIGELTGVDQAHERLEGTAAAVAWCAANGVHIVRVHDVAEMVKVVRVIDAIARERATGPG
jgi:dihydropteroate synthase